MKTFNVRTAQHCELVDITRQVQRCVDESGAKNGIAIVFVPHTTAGVSINENADPDVKRDVLFALARTVPRAGFLHAEGNSDAHTKAHMTGFSQTLIIDGGVLVLGTWQSIYFCEFDGPHTRKVHVKIIKSDD